ncbi:response regulator transcription factor [Pigmentiphaga litoralis]|uniref:DNA-binding NarL/FixJ family response regulator n=1 Tax=Pigmentiphaga litoralis TaxID=516702 RepID=A0A7Y9LLJ7_9BURK|nr:response regulator transcription factor [Pigmentiphaga litoralis]NYE25239.1 DNA-binding NarL/FixJ family response regulator [Pigmentiphaga litoralis]NYE81148.1 DNA-binding NarL/FixJ family response regulator [Pigmentiphaga litoralis]
MNVLLIEDQPVFQAAVRRVLETIQGVNNVSLMTPDNVAEQASSGTVELLVFGCTSRSDTDLRLLSDAVRKFMPYRSLVFYDTPDPSFIYGAVLSGVSGYVPKSATPMAVWAAINLVLAGGYCYPPMAGGMAPAMSSMGALNPASGPIALRAGPRSELTKRQYELLRLLASGVNMRIIGERMGISVATVKSHARSLYWKLSASNQTEAVFNAIQRGLL